MTTPANPSFSALRAQLAALHDALTQRHDAPATDTLRDGPARSGDCWAAG